MSYDVKCYDLAEAFLSDTPALNTPSGRDLLAQHIQDAIEAWLLDREVEVEAAKPPSP